MIERRAPPKGHALEKVPLRAQTAGHGTGRLAALRPTLELPELVVEVNRVFHAFEASRYDDRHAEISEQVPVRWRELFGSLPIANEAQWSLLDFGAGTGFATLQAVACLPKEKIGRVVCVDTSREMLARCRERLSTLLPQAEFHQQLPEAATFDLLLTNSVLHHLPDVDTEVRRIERLLAPKAWWIQSHEPSTRFYRNPELRAHHEAFLRHDRWARFFQPRRCFGALKQLFGRDPYRLAARECVARGLFELEPDVATISRLVDFGVAHSLEEANEGKSFNLQELQRLFAGRWRLVAACSYSFMGSRYEGRLSPKWQERCAAMARRFPDDGANFGGVWRRV